MKNMIFKNKNMINSDRLRIKEYKKLISQIKEEVTRHKNENYGESYETVVFATLNSSLIVFIVCIGIILICVGCTRGEFITTERTSIGEIYQGKVTTINEKAESYTVEDETIESPQYEEGIWRIEGNNTYFDTNLGETINSRIYRIDGDYYLFDESGIMRKNCFLDISYLDGDMVIGGITSNALSIKLPENLLAYYFDYEGKQVFNKVCIHQYKDKINHTKTQKFWLNEQGITQKEIPGDIEGVQYVSPKNEKEDLEFSGYEYLQQKLSFQDILKDVNNQHNISKYYPGFEDFLQHKRGEVAISQSEVNSMLQAPQVENVTITREEALLDVDLYFRSLKYAYGPYYYFGEENFVTAKENVDEELQTRDNVDTKELSNIISKNMEFIRDGHFYIGNHGLNTRTKKYKEYYSLVQFSKDDDGFYIDDGKKWYYQDINNDSIRIRYSLSSTGDLAYRLIQFCPPAYKEDTTRIVLKCGDQTKTIEVEWIESKPYSRESFMNNPDYRYFENDGIMYVSCRDYHLELMDQLQEYIKTGRYARNARLIIFDIRGNVGGSSHFSGEWFKQFTGREADFGGAFAEWVTALDYAIRAPIGSEYYIKRNKDGTKLDNEIPIIVLVDDNCGSGGESAIMQLRTLKNVIVIGSNSGGCILSGADAMYLPNSKLRVAFGPAIGFYYGFENIDGKGYEPDIWCDPENALMWVLAMLRKNSIMSEETWNEFFVAGISK